MAEPNLLPTNAPEITVSELANALKRAIEDACEILQKTRCHHPLSEKQEIVAFSVSARRRLKTSATAVASSRPANRVVRI